MIYFCEEVARKKLNQPPEWKSCIWERIGPDAQKIEGGIPTIRTRGKYKGRPKWGKRSEFVACIVTDEEVRQEEQRYETETGNCCKCQGSGQVVWSISVTDGTKYRECKPCKGTGKATR
jgi:hypothetical protein